MPEMLRINHEVDNLIATIQVTLRIQTGCNVSKIEVVRRALNELAGQLNVPRLQEDFEPDEDRR